MQTNLSKSKEPLRPKSWPLKILRDASEEKQANNGTRLLVSAVKQRGRERKGTKKKVMKFRLRNWPISSADLFPYDSYGRDRHLFGPFQEKDFGAMSGGPIALLAPSFYFGANSKRAEDRMDSPNPKHQNRLFFGDLLFEARNLLSLK